MSCSVQKWLPSSELDCVCRDHMLNKVFPALSFRFFAGGEGEKTFGPTGQHWFLIQKMDPGQCYLAVNADQEFDSGPRRVQDGVVKRGEHKNLELARNLCKRMEFT